MITSSSNQPSGVTKLKTVNVRAQCSQYLCVCVADGSRQKGICPTIILIARSVRAWHARECVR